MCFRLWGLLAQGELYLVMLSIIDLGIVNSRELKPLVSSKVVYDSFE